MLLGAISRDGGHRYACANILRVSNLYAGNGFTLKAGIMTLDIQKAPKPGVMFFIALGIECLFTVWGLIFFLNIHSERFYSNSLTWSISAAAVGVIVGTMPHNYMKTPRKGPNTVLIRGLGASLVWVSLFVGVSGAVVYGEKTADLKSECFTGTADKISLSISSLKDADTSAHYSDVLARLQKESQSTWGVDSKFCEDVDGLLVDVKESVKVESLG